MSNSAPALHNQPAREDSDSPPALKDLPSLLLHDEDFGSVVRALRQGRSATVDGAWGSSAALAAAALAGQTPSTSVIVLAHPRDVDGWVSDLISFSGIRPVVFAAWDNQPTAHLDEIAAARLRVLRQLEVEPPRVVLTTIQALMQPVPDRQKLAGDRRVLRKGDVVDLEELATWLVEHGYQPGEVVELAGEFGRRGGIVDVFSPDADYPCRIEFFGDEVESIRRFDPQSQRSLGLVDLIELMGVGPPPDADGSADGGLPMTGHLCDYLPRDAWTILVEPEDLSEQGNHYLERTEEQRGLFTVQGVFEQLLRFANVKVSQLPSPTVEAICHLRVESIERFSGEISRVREELESIAGRDQVLIACQTEAECQRLSELLAPDGEGTPVARPVVGRVDAGFRLLTLGKEFGGAPPKPPGDGGVVVVASQELFHREARLDSTPTPRRRLESRAIDSFLDLNAGDLVVHVSHGIARFRGMQLIHRQSERKDRQPSQLEEHLVLEFRNNVRVFVPASRIDLVQKYVGSSKSDPELSVYGGSSWQKRKARVEEAVLDLASDMIQMQALREAQAGIALPADSDWQRAFEASFPFQETPDQLTTLVELKADMQRARPMDRLICGDVGYGKTELAIRAAFKAIDNGRQVAVLVPTTVLAEQHHRTFSQRLAEYPFVVECLSRFRSHGQQKRILERLARGGVDVIIGTHRLVSKDVVFKDLGLVIIDEEQRFGVEHKDRLKKLRQLVDVLTLTATPIPRTLHLSLLGIRDISNLETPPPNRHSIETRIVRFDRALIRNAILRELNREGQVFFVHNRVQDIHAVAERVKEIVPEARYAIVHGQMEGHELEQNMLRFVRREVDVLVATTIIESGLDIPSANTIFINQADNYGLADLHQLRGRVGRYHHRAYAYLLLDGNKQVTTTAAKRLKAIEEYTDLGAGFKIALRDLEIRGAGNILGTQQSGHIAAVGYELYCQLLENAVRQLRNQPSRAPLAVAIDLPWPAYLPHSYITSTRLRIEAYRRLARIRHLDRLDEFREELRDRYGPMPDPADWLLRLSEIRVLCSRWKIGQLHLEKISDSSPTDVVLGYRDRKRIQRLASRSGGRLRIVDDASAYFRLLPQELPMELMYEVIKTVLADPS